MQHYDIIPRSKMDRSFHNIHSVTAGLSLRPISRYLDLLCARLVSIDGQSL